MKLTDAPLNTLLTLKSPFIGFNITFNTGTIIYRLNTHTIQCLGKTRIIDSLICTPNVKLEINYTALMIQEGHCKL